MTGTRHIGTPRYPWFRRVVNSIADKHRFKRIEDNDVEMLRGKSRLIARPGKRSDEIFYFYFRSFRVRLWIGDPIFEKSSVVWKDQQL